MSFWKKNLLPLWLGFALVAVVPFLSILRMGVLSSFYLESASLIFVLILVLMGHLRGKIPATAVYFLVLAGFWAVHSRLVGVPYLGLSDAVSGAFLIFALMAWGCRNWVDEWGQERVVTVLAWVLLLGTSLQAVVAWLQFTDLASKFSGILMYRKGVIEGQLGQRNHLGHYMMWGVLATAYLWSVKQLRWWWACLFLVYLTATMGLIGSRTVLIYFVMLALLLPFWWLNVSWRKERSVACFAVAGALVLIFQLFLKRMLALGGSGHLRNLTSAVERVNNESFLQSGRSFEWAKAWQAFCDAPWLGQGWGSFSWQSFTRYGEVNGGFRLYDSGVLFTHSHNSFLNLLAEMGLLGTILVLGGWVFFVRRCWRAKNPASLLLLSLMGVSLAHSSLEYPLWYIYFLSVFALFVCLTPAPVREVSAGVWQTAQSKMLMALAWLALGKIAYLVVVYQDLQQASRTGGNSQQKAQRIADLLHIANTQPFFKHYAQLGLINHIQPHDEFLPDWAYTHARESILYRPYAHAYKLGLLAQRQGDTATAKEWLAHSYRYYPHNMVLYGNTIMKYDDFKDLRPQYLEFCQKYYRIIGKTEQCVRNHQEQLAQALKKSIREQPQ